MINGLILNKREIGDPEERNQRREKKHTFEK